MRAQLTVSVWSYSTASVVSLADKTISRDTVTCYVKLVGLWLMKWMGKQKYWDQTENQNYCMRDSLNRNDVIYWITS